MNTNFYCAPGEKLSEQVKEALNNANSNYSRSKDFSRYLRDIEAIFKLKQASKNMTTEHRLFLGGFVEGEGSLNVSAKKLANAKFGILIDPEFSLTQHVNGVVNLYDAMTVFKTGRIRFKAGSNATLVFTIDNRRSLEEKVIPFWESYVAPYGSFTKQQRLFAFKKLIQLFNENCHKDLNCLLNEILPIWDKMRMQRGQSNESFESLEDAQNYVKTFVNA
jgi:LAGLIDADG endonuclease